MTSAFIGLGSNMDFPERHIDTAITALDEMAKTRLIAVSSLYKSKPVGPQDQDDFINAVAEIDTWLDPVTLLDCLQDIENRHGRVRKKIWGERTLDLDILMYGDEKITNKRLTVPHVEMLRRAFVLVPLAEVKPDCHIPGAGSINDYLDKVNADELELLQ